MTSSSNGRRCTVCSSTQLREITEALALGISGSQVSQRFGLSADALYRHIRNGHGVDAQTIVLIDSLADSTDALERIVEIADSARQTRRVAMASGNVLNATRAADSELKALGVMLTQLGVRDSAILDALQATNQLVDAVARIVWDEPRLGTKLAEILDEAGAHDLASSYRVLVHRMNEEKEKQR